MRISRVALLTSLLAGALPLAAKDDVDQPHSPHLSNSSNTKNEEKPKITKSTTQQESSLPITEAEILDEVGDESSDETDSAAKVVHDDGVLYTIPPLPADLLDSVNTGAASSDGVGSSNSSTQEEQKTAQHVEVTDERGEQEEEKRRRDDDDDKIESKKVDDADDSEITSINATFRKEQEKEKQHEDIQLQERNDEGDGTGATKNSNTSQSSSPQEEKEEALLENNDDETLKKENDTRIKNNKEKDEKIQQQEDVDASSTQEATETATTATESQDKKETREETANTESSSAVEEKNKEEEHNNHEEEEEEDGRSKRVQVDYANKAAGALILEKSKSFKGASNLLLNDIDRYAIAPCADKKYVIVGLSEDILVKTIKIANYERYSSPPKKIQVLGSSDMITFVDIGEFVAHSGNGEQSFDLDEPAWARYLKFRFSTHYGAEHYCTVSQIKVHGSTMTQGFQEQYMSSDKNQEEEEFEVIKENEEGEGSDNSMEEETSTDSNDVYNVGNDDVDTAGTHDLDSSPNETVKYQKQQQNERAALDNESGEGSDSGGNNSSIGNNASSSTLPNLSMDDVGESPKSDSGVVVDKTSAKNEDKNKDDSNSDSNNNGGLPSSCDGGECADAQFQLEEKERNVEGNISEAEVETHKSSEKGEGIEKSTSISDAATRATSATTISLDSIDDTKGAELPEELKKLSAIVSNLGATTSNINGDTNEMKKKADEQILFKSSPHAQLTADTFDDSTETIILSSASIGTSSSAKTSSVAEEEENAMLMNDASYSVKNVIETVRQSASSTKVAGAVKELQKIILTKIGSSTSDEEGELQLTEGQPILTEDAANEIDRKKSEEGVTVGAQTKNEGSASNANNEETTDKTNHAETPEESSTNKDLSRGSGSASATAIDDGNNDRKTPRSTVVDRSEEVHTSPKDAVHTSKEESKLGTKMAGTHDSISHKKQQSQSAGSSKHHSTNQGLDIPTKLPDGMAHSATDLFAHLSQKFPSMACLNGLDYQEFRSKMISGRAGGSVGGSGSSGSAGGAGGGAGGGPPNRVEPIFKTLTDEIKALQNMQSTHEQYIRTLQGCYQQIVLDMAMHIDNVESSQEDRLATLESALRDLREERNIDWTKQYASWLYTMVSEATEQVVPILLATAGWCYTFGLKFFFWAEDLMSDIISSVLDWIIREIENDEIKLLLKSIASMDRETARQWTMFLCLSFWLVLTQIRLCRVQRKNKRRSIRGGGVSMVHLHGTEGQKNAVACPQGAKVQRGDVHSHDMHDDMSYSDLSESETPLTPIVASPSA